MKKWIVVLRLAQQSVPEKIEFARLVASSMTDNKYYGDPIPGIDLIVAHTQALQLAYNNAQEAPSKENTATMHTKAFELDVQLTALGNYVQRIANENGDNGGAIIFSAAMDVKRSGGRAEVNFTVKNTSYAGEVELITRAEGRASYIWQYSLDKEEWQNGNVTLQATTTIADLKPGKRYYFRVAAVLKEKQGPWQGPINIIVT